MHYKIASILEDIEGIQRALIHIDAVEEGNIYDLQVWEMKQVSFRKKAL